MGRPIHVAMPDDRDLTLPERTVTSAAADITVVSSARRSRPSPPLSARLSVRRAVTAAPPHGAVTKSVAVSALPAIVNQGECTYSGESVQIRARQR